MKKLYKALMLLGAGLLLGTTARAQVVDYDVDYMLYPDYSPEVKADWSLMTPVTKDDDAELPDHWNNAEFDWFPPVVSQVGGSCGSASRIYYMFAYEVNAWRRAKANTNDNIYPTHFTWLLTYCNSGKEGMAAANGVPNATTYGGTTYSKLFGVQDWKSNCFGWMQGYDKWYNAMCSRITGNANFAQSVKTEAGREAVKRWIYNHNGDPDWNGVGGICGIGVASGGTWKSIPSTEANDAAGVSGKKYVYAWGSSVDHALTIVGYDDRIEFDIDGNGVYGETDKDEVGAWIVVNSWGSGWCNDGFIYCPYANATPTSAKSGYYQPEIYYVRKDYRPLRTFKITMQYSKRSELRLAAGVSQDTTASKPEYFTLMEHFKYAGDGDGDGEDAETPMLGEWADGMHYEPMEFGYDITDISSQVDVRKPVKYFLRIESKSGASGEGSVDALSLMDYEFDENGVEIPFPLDAEGVEIKTNGGITYISYVVKGEAINAPRNAAQTGDALTWDAPEASSFTLTGYNVYQDGTLIATLDPSVTDYTAPDANASYAITAVYDYSGSSVESSSATFANYSNFGGTSFSNPNYVAKFTNSGFTIKNLFPTALTNATIEYWLKPTSLSSWNQYVGPGWGAFLIHTDANGALYAGWNTGNRAVSSNKALTTSSWTHIAVVVEGSDLTLYVNGEPAGSCSGSTSGIGALGDFTFGSLKESQSLNAQIDEVRIWKTARTQTQINQYMYTRITDPTNMPGLMCEIPMDEVATGDTITDHAQGHKIVYLAKPASANAFVTLRDQRSLTADFTMPEVVSTNTAIDFTNASSGNAISFAWNIDGTEYAIDSPSHVFTSTGEKTATLIVKDAKEKADTCTKTFTVSALGAPTALFEPTATVVYEGDRVSFVNKSEGATSYSWTAEGATTTEAVTTHFATSWDAAGTYPVTLTATNAAGSTTYTVNIKVNVHFPAADFELTPDITVVPKNIKITDNSTYSPTKWHWVFEAEDTVIVRDKKTASMYMRTPGVWDVTLYAGNDLGWGNKTKKRALITCTTDGEQGLNFSGSKSTYVTFDNPITSDRFTIAYWLYPVANSSNSQGLGGTRSQFLIEGDADGRIIMNAGGEAQQTASDQFTRAQWHHFAYVVDGTQCTVYRDCKEVGQFTFSGNIKDNLPSTWKIGGSLAPMNAVIDELQMWNDTISLDDLKTYANYPISDVTTAESNGLALYYQFNQDSGDVEDATSGARTGKRTGFGPDGDSWTETLGIFCLPLHTPTDVTADYLTNYENPFRHTEYSVNEQADNADAKLELETGTTESTWVISTDSESETAPMFFVDQDNEGALGFLAGQSGFDTEVHNLKLWQTITLPAGYYVFGITAYDDINVEGSYLVIDNAETIPDNMGEAFKFTDIRNKQINFTIAEETQLSLGALLNATSVSSAFIKNFYLLKKGTNDTYTFDGIEVPLASEVAADGKIYDLQGRRAARADKGIYIINGQKVVK